jgi:hypothetical protein
MKIRRFELFRMRQVVEEMPKGDKFKFSYAVAKNLRLIKSEIEDMEKTIEPAAEVNEYEKERIKLCKDLAEKENGEPILENKVVNGIMGSQFKIGEGNKDKFSFELGKLRDKYADALTSQKKSVEEYNLALREAVDIEFHTVRIEDVPQDIKPSDLEAILDWVKPEEVKAPEKV